MYLLDNISFDDYNILPSMIEKSNIALSGFLDMPKRLGKTYHSWEDENGIEPYVSASEITFGGRDIHFKGLLKAGNFDNAVASLTSLFEQIDGFTDLISFQTPYGTFKVYMKDKITVDYFQDGWATIQMSFREPIVRIPANFISPVFISSDFIETVCNPIIEDFPSPTFEVQGIDGIPFTEIGVFVKSVSDNFMRAAAKQPNIITTNSSESFQITKTELKKIRLNLLVIAETTVALKQNINALFVLLAKPELRQLQADSRVLNMFSKDGFKVREIKLNGNVNVAEIDIELVII